MVRGRGCKVGVSLHREQDDVYARQFSWESNLICHLDLGRAILNQLVDVDRYDIGTLLVAGAKCNSGGLG